MSGTDLAGLGILVTRPAHQAGPLCEAVEAQGGRAICFPVLEIVDPEDVGALLDVIDRLDSFDIAVFISPNAVNKAINRIRARRELPTGLKLAAVGRGSAKELGRLGLQADIFPKQRFDSEALLAMDEMQQVAGKRVVIFRGDGGRELLAETLKGRGAEVEYAECYRRAKPKGDVGKLMRHWARGDIDVVVVTSNEGLSNLFDMVGQLGRQWLRKTQLVVVSPRQAELAKELGFKLEPVIAETASDEAVVEAIKAWRERAPAPVGNPA